MKARAMHACMLWQGGKGRARQVDEGGAGEKQRRLRGVVGRGEGHDEGGSRHRGIAVSGDCGKGGSRWRGIAAKENRGQGGSRPRTKGDLKCQPGA